MREWFFSFFSISKFLSKPRLSLKHVAEAGNLAEEVISTIRTAQAFGTQKILSNLYDTHIGYSLEADLESATWHGGALAVFFFVIYSAYALGMWYIRLSPIIFLNLVTLRSLFLRHYTH